jgi:hypothetical protein
MDCRTFRKHHLAFVDDTLPGVDVVRMQLHLAECADCEAWDHRVRRSLLVVRNHLGTIEPSERFRARLDARLAQEKATLAAAPALFGGGLRRFPVWPLALGVVVLGVTVTALGRVADPAVDVKTLPGAVVVGPLGASLMSNGVGPGNAQPAFIATFSSGMAILPALMLVDEAPALGAAADEFAASTARTASYVPQER